MHIAIAGNIGAGKTTLTNMLARHYGWTPQLEKVVDNPYLSDYYRQLERWCFNLEVFFLKERFKDVLKINQSEKTVIQDRSIFEGVYVFAKNNHEQGIISDLDFDTYMELFGLMMQQVKMPDLMIYLRADTRHLVENIQKRARDYEQAIKLEYLQGLNKRYEEFVYQHYKGRVLTVNVDDMDFEHVTEDFRYITDRIDQILFGLFPLDEQAADNSSGIG